MASSILASLIPLGVCLTINKHLKAKDTTSDSLIDRYHREEEERERLGMTKVEYGMYKIRPGVGERGDVRAGQVVVTAAPPPPPAAAATTTGPRARTPVSLPKEAVPPTRPDASIPLHRARQVLRGTLLLGSCPLGLGVLTWGCLVGNGLAIATGLGSFMLLPLHSIGNQWTAGVKVFEDEPVYCSGVCRSETFHKVTGYKHVQQRTKKVNGKDYAVNEVVTWYDRVCKVCGRSVRT